MIEQRSGVIAWREHEPLALLDLEIQPPHAHQRKPECQSKNVLKSHCAMRMKTQIHKRHYSNVNIDDHL